MDRFPPSKQRQPLLKFLEVVDARQSSLRRDECGDWRIHGKFADIYAVPPAGGYQLLVGADINEPISPRRWTRIKESLNFCELAQDGDQEGSLLLGRLPTPEEAALIRDALAIPKARHLSPEQREKLIATLAQARIKAGLSANARVPDGDSQPPTQRELA